MCLIIHKPKGATIEKWILESAKEYNPDGIGIMANSSSERFLKIATDKVYDKINGLDNAVIHFRMATHGAVDIANCHPFKLHGGIFLMHNGIMNSYNPPKDSKDSDTATFVKEFCNPSIAVNGKLNLKLFESAMTGQVMALMHRHGRITRHGNFHDYEGCYYSNHYAWDSPATWKYSDTKYPANYASNYPALPYHGVTDSVGYKSCDNMIDDFLYSAVFQLPLETNEYVDHRDDDIYDDLWSYKIDASQFLEECSPETKINLFSYLVEKGML